MSAATQARLLNVQEAAELLGVPVGWVRDHASGKRAPVIPSFKVGKYRRFRADELEKWLERSREGGRAA